MRAYDVFMRFLRRATDVPAAPAGQISLEVVNVGSDPELRMVDEFGVAWPIGSGGGGSPNLDGGIATSTYGAISPISGGTA